MRLFIAINFDDAFKDGVGRLQTELGRAFPEGRLTPRDNLHLTIAFLGECDEARLPEIKAAMISAAGERFKIITGEAGQFGHGDVRWLGIEKNLPLENLAERLTRQLKRRGFVLEDRAFIPHITLGRNMTPPPLAGAADLSRETLKQEIRSFELMESRQKDGETVYLPKFSVNFR